MTDIYGVEKMPYYPSFFSSLLVFSDLIQLGKIKLIFSRKKLTCKCSKTKYLIAYWNEFILFHFTPS